MFVYLQYQSENHLALRNAWLTFGLPDEWADKVNYRVSLLIIKNYNKMLKWVRGRGALNYAGMYQKFFKQVFSLVGRE